MTKRVEEWIAFGKRSNKNLFFYQDKVLDLTRFMDIHPGGRKALINYLNKDITNIIFTVYPHKKETTLVTLMKYVIGKIPEEDVRQHQKTNRDRSVTPVKDKKKACQKQQEKKTTEEAIKSSTKSKSSKIKDSKGKQTSKQKKKKDSKQRSKSKDKVAKKSRQNLSKEQIQMTNWSSQSINSDLDEEKPVFKVPVLCTKNIFWK